MAKENPKSLPIISDTAFQSYLQRIDEWASTERQFLASRGKCHCFERTTFSQHLKVFSLLEPSLEIQFLADQANKEGRNLTLLELMGSGYGFVEQMNQDDIDSWAPATIPTADNAKVDLQGVAITLEDLRHSEAIKKINDGQQVTVIPSAETGGILGQLTWEKTKTWLKNKLLPGFDLIFLKPEINGFRSLGFPYKNLIFTEPDDWQPGLRIYQSLITYASQYLNPNGGLMLVQWPPVEIEKAKSVIEGFLHNWLAELTSFPNLTVRAEYLPRDPQNIITATDSYSVKLYKHR